MCLSEFAQTTPISFACMSANESVSIDDFRLGLKGRSISIARGWPGIYVAN